LTTIQGYLETYLKSEGLFEIIPENRRHNLFTLPIALIWIFIFWSLNAFFIIKQKSLHGVIPAIIGTPILILFALIILSIIFAFRQKRINITITQSDSNIIGSILLFGLPFISAIILGIYLFSLRSFVLYTIIYIICITALLIINVKSYNVHLIIELFRSILIALGQSINLLISIIPILLVVILLSVFSRDLWETLSKLSLIQFIECIFWLAIPAFLYSITSLKREVALILGEFPKNEVIISNAENTEFIKYKLDNGFISEEEWNGIIQELKWRTQTKYIEGIFPKIQKKVRLWLALILIFIEFTLILAFWGFFFGLFTIMISPSQIADWTHTQLNSIPMSIMLFGEIWFFDLPITLRIMAQVSLLLAFFVSIFGIISAFSNEPLKLIITEWLKNKSASWLAVSILYNCLVSPNYYVWEYIVRNDERGIANVFIIVRPDLSETQIKQACEHMEARLSNYKNFVIVTAFEQSEDKQIYRIELEKKQWRLFHNKFKNIRNFNFISFENEELRYQHLLGRDAITNQASIPNEWFGNTTDTIYFSKVLWDADSDHEWILHPYISINGEILMVDIQMTKRKAKSKEYHEYLKQLFKLTRQSFPNIGNIMIDIYFRDTTQLLSRIIWGSQLPFIDYKDELIKKTRYEKQKDWE